MPSRITFLLLLILMPPQNAARQKRSSVFTLLRIDTGLHGPSLVFNKSLVSGVFEFQFKTFVNRALVLYQDDKGKSDYIQVSIQSGRVWFNVNVGTFIAGTFTSRKKYNDFRWHTLRIERNASMTSIILDNGKERKSFNTEGHLSSFVSGLIIGGFDHLSPNDITDHGAYSIYIHPLTKRGYFNACVRNVRYGETKQNMKEITNDYIKKNRVLEGCELNYCHKPDPICKNNGKCFAVEKTNVTCDCEWTGFTGKTCTKPALELTFNGSYKVKCILSNKSNIRKEKYAFRIKTTQENALLFMASGPQNHKDFIRIEVKSWRIRLTVNFGQDVDYDVESKVRLDDGRWHYVEYDKNNKLFTLRVDTTSQEYEITGAWQNVDYSKDSFLGEISNVTYTGEVKIQDFIRISKEKDKVNFVTGLYDSYRTHNAGFRVEPKYVLPKFSERLPYTTPKPLPSTRATLAPSLTGEVASPGETTSTAVASGPQARGKSDDEDDSSITWIIVVTVIFSVLVLAAVVFFVHKWNQRYSGDFQVNRKPIGPAGTIVHYQDAAHKEKQRQMKL